MRIVIDMQGAQTINRFRGIGRYTLSLVSALVHQAEAHHEVWLVQNSQLPLLSETVRQQYFSFIPPYRLLTCHVPPPCPWNEPASLWWQRAGEYCREAFLASLNPDWVLVGSLFEGDDQGPAYTSIGTLFPEVPTAVILYDLIPLLNAGEYLCGGLKRDWYLNKVDNLFRADRILAISEYARREAVVALDLPEQRIVTIGSAYNDNLFKPLVLDEPTRSGLMRKYGITSPFIMHNGTLEPRKNLDGLIRAYALLPRDLQNQYQLVFVGEVSAEDRSVFHNLAHEMGCGERLVLTGHVGDEDLVRLFNAATLFVYPSLHEGFGLPAVEAMACGTPTIGSDCTSIPEVIGLPDALFDPKNPQAMSGLIRHALATPDFAERLRRHGLERAHCFSWDRCAQRTLEALGQPIERLSAKRFSWRRLWGRCLPNGRSWPDVWDRDTDQTRNDQGLDREHWQSLTAQQRRRDCRLITAIAALGPACTADIEELARCIDENQQVSGKVLRLRSLPPLLRWRIEGPFDSSYSLALLNRETALALHQLGHEVALHSTEGPGDFAPSPDFLAAHPLLAQMHQHATRLPALSADVTSRNLYPPRVADLDCRVNLLHHYAWEESGLPAQWVEEFNAFLQGMTCLSGHVQKVLVDNGVTVPLAVSGCGVDHWLRIDPDDTFAIAAKTFRFLHVSSCFPRKGVDVLLAAYGQAFTAADDVTLIIKTFANPHNEITRWLADARAAQPDFPEVLVIEEELSAACLKALYQQCQVLVAPSRAEGFGLPMAEAMLSGLAVITTNWGGQLDFCTEETAWLVDYQFAPSRSHFEVYDSVWAEPDREHLARRMREVFLAPNDQRQQRIDAGRDLLRKQFRWTLVAERLVAAAREWMHHLYPPTSLHIGWISTWNTRCGIAGYSGHLVSNINAPITILAPEKMVTELVAPDAENVVRCWQQYEDDLHQLTAAIDARKCNTLIMQFNYFFFHFDTLTSFLENQLAAGRIVILTLHSTIDPPDYPDRSLALLVPVLRRCHRLLVHSVSDLNRLKRLGLVENVALFPHGVVAYADLYSENSPPVAATGPFRVGSFGFFLPHKGLLELIDAIALLREQGVDLHLRLVNAEYPIPVSQALIEQARQIIAQRALEGYCELYTEFLPDEWSLSLLRDCDCLVFPYQNTAESSSSAVRYGLSTGRPVAVTPHPIFADVAPATVQLPGFTVRDIAHGIREILQPRDQEALRKMAKEAKRWREHHTHARLGSRLLGLCQALHNQTF
jgi:glycosyltransferase involved in cell wall biosynthesis